MSRVFAILVILVLMAVVALVPRMGSKEPGDQERDLGKGYAYKADTLRRFRLLLEDPGWTLADPPRNAQGMLEAVHERTDLTFALIPAGRYLMGSPGKKSLQQEGPVHRVSVASFLMCTTECTQAAWDRVGGLDERFWQGPDLPLEGASWIQITTWCRKAAGGLRLPTEAEWEFACRGGGVSRFTFGDDPVDLPNYAWLGENSESRTHPVGWKRPQAYGLFDMHGNVSELCEDHWAHNYLYASDDGSAHSLEHASVPFQWRGRIGVWVDYRVHRGGSFRSDPTECRSACRNSVISDASDPSIGFRPAANLPLAVN